jgi:hypothetical protein
MDNLAKNACSTTPDGTKKSCPIKCLMAAGAVFIVIFIFEALFHGVFMMSYYKATASVWRPEADMHSYMYISLVRQIVTALVFTCLYSWVKKAECPTECPVKTGVKLGVKIGVLLGIAQFGSYVWLPLPSIEIPLLWLIGNIILGALMGATLGGICKMSKKNCDKTDSAS